MDAHVVGTLSGVNVNPVEWTTHVVIDCIDWCVHRWMGVNAIRLTEWLTDWLGTALNWRHFWSFSLGSDRSDPIVTQMRLEFNFFHSTEHDVMLFHAVVSFLSSFLLLVALIAKNGEIDWFNSRFVSYWTTIHANDEQDITTSHTHTRVCVCVCVCVSIYNLISIE